MYCVICGCALNNENQEGLVCRGCKQERIESRRIKELVRVSYCYECGKPFHPTDNSIRHLYCFMPEITTRIER